MPLSPALWLTALIFLLGVMPASLTLAAGPAQASSGSLGEQQVKAFTWFGPLGFPDVKGRTLVRVATGRWYRSDDDPPRNTYRGRRLTKLFVLAGACWRNGSEQTAAELYAAAARLPKRYGENSDKPFDKPLQQVVADKLAHAEMWRAIEAFGDPQVSRAQLLERFERLLKNYPNSEHAKQARESTTLLRKMVQEDVEYAARRKAGKSFDQLTTQNLCWGADRH